MSNKQLSYSSSLFLDGLRLVSALIVFFAHSQAVWFPEKMNDLIPSHLSHGAVIVFFVLSGFVIAYTTTNKKRTAKEYIVARLSRLYSIFFPAIIITIICAMLANLINPEIYSNYSRGNDFFRYLIALFYCNEIWFFSSAPLINGPIWSLGYEFWYYAIFGLIFYKTSGFKGWILPLIMMFFVGPKILLMMIIWIFGLAAYYIPKPKISNILSWLLIVILLFVSVFFMVFLPSIPFKMGTPPLFWASQFLSDYLIGLFIAIAVWLMPTLNIAAPTPTISKNRHMYFRKMADMTFPIYVLHFPILVFMKTIIPTSISRNHQLLIGSSISLLICFIMGLILENYKSKWIWLFNKILNTKRIVSNTTN